MGGQVYKAPQRIEDEINKKREEAEKAAQWRTSQMLQSVMPSGSNRIIDWRSMPSSCWR
jgi:hypothetical protein